MRLADRIDAFARLGEVLKEELEGVDLKIHSPDITAEALFPSIQWRELVKEAGAVNPWFTPFAIHHALGDICRILERAGLEAWTGRYGAHELKGSRTRKVGSILAGNIPLVGFHDFLSILITGHHFVGKLSGKDDRLLPFLAEQLLSLQPAFGRQISFAEERLGGVEAIIATGSNNTSRYFEYYFGKYPHIFRKNRNGAAVLSGKETREELEALADDIFLYFGLGCRNVAKLYVPEGYDFSEFFGAMDKYASFRDHHKYANNFLYRRSVFLMNRVEHLDNGFLLVTPDHALSSPVSVLHYETYRELNTVEKQLKLHRDEIQCVVGTAAAHSGAIPFGQSQHPELWEYADDMDTLKFLSNLS